MRCMCGVAVREEGRWVDRSLMMHTGRSRGVGEGDRRGVRGQSARRNRRTARQHPAGEPERVRDAVGELARFRPFTFDCRVVRVPEGLCVVHVIYRECEWYT